LSSGIIDEKKDKVYLRRLAKKLCKMEGAVSFSPGSPGVIKKK